MVARVGTRDWETTGTRAQTRKLQAERRKWHEINAAMREERPVAAVQPSPRSGRARRGVLVSGLHVSQQQQGLCPHAPTADELYPVMRVSEQLGELPLGAEDRARLRDAELELEQVASRLQAYADVTVKVQASRSARRAEEEKAAAKDFAKKGNRALSGGDLEAATAHYRRALASAQMARDPSLVAVLLASRSEIHYANGQYAMALADAQAAQEADPRLVDAASAEMMRCAEQILQEQPATDATVEAVVGAAADQTRRQQATAASSGMMRPVPPTTPRSAVPAPRNAPPPTRYARRRVRAARQAQARLAHTRLEPLPLLARIHEGQRASMHAPATHRHAPRTWLGFAKELEWHRRRTSRLLGGESFLRVHWVAVPKATRARRANRRRSWPGRRGRGFLGLGHASTSSSPGRAAPGRAGGHEDRHRAGLSHGLQIHVGAPGALAGGARGRECRCG
jgi:tetratricopeptide (TPR) repeat protein